MRGNNGGPKTAGGKAVVSRNATKYGIHSPAPVIPGMERQEDWLRHYDGLIESFQPEGNFEQLLIYRLAHVAWRIHRVSRFEQAVIEHQVSKTEEDRWRADALYYGLEAIIDQADGKSDDIPEPTPEELQNAREMRIIPWKDDLARVMRYEAQLHRQFLQTLHELEAAQARRRGERAPLARFDISSSPP